MHLLRSPRGGICMKFGTGIATHVVNCVSFFDSRLSCLDSVGGQILACCIDLGSHG